MISNRCTRKKENVLIAIMRTVRGHQNLRKMEMLIANQEAVVVLPHHRHHHHPGIIMILRESDTCHQSFVKQIICMKNKKSIEESYLTSVESKIIFSEKSLSVPMSVCLSVRHVPSCPVTKKSHLNRKFQCTKLSDVFKW